ncbi:MAG: Ku protein [Pseudomonas sp.]|uniref:non-homologous end joining protein Ku n=1 Tax=Pseudomonas sp. TaxID=306 RepID=UPI0033911DBA
MPRVVWKGAISFGLVHIPVALVPATHSSGIDFDWLDKRSMDKVGYKRVNKVTGKEVASADIVKGVEYERDRYVVLSEEEICAAHPEATRTIDILAFVEARQIPFVFLDTPYYLTPDARGDKVYGLLREALEKTAKVALANVVMHSKQHLAVVMPTGPALVLHTLRWADDVRGIDSLELSPEAIEPKLAAKELEMATRLVKDMVEPWAPEQYHDTFQKQIMALVERKAKSGRLESVAPADADQASAEIIDLTELLKRSLARKPAAATKPRTKKSS